MICILEAMFRRDCAVARVVQEVGQGVEEGERTRQGKGREWTGKSQCSHDMPTTCLRHAIEANDNKRCNSCAAARAHFRLLCAHPLVGPALVPFLKRLLPVMALFRCKHFMVHLPPPFCVGVAGSFTGKLGYLGLLFGGPFNAALTWQTCNT